MSYTMRIKNSPWWKKKIFSVKFFLTMYEQKFPLSSLSFWIKYICSSLYTCSIEGMRVEKQVRYILSFPWGWDVMFTVEEDLHAFCMELASSGTWFFGVSIVVLPKLSQQEQVSTNGAVPTVEPSLWHRRKDIGASGFAQMDGLWWCLMQFIVSLPREN